jgi:NDP-sugar pyrophosphorylase family protein
VVIVLNGDILTDIPLGQMIKFHRRNKNLATLGLVRVEDPTAYGLVLLDKQTPGDQVFGKTRFGRSGDRYDQRGSLFV